MANSVFLCAECGKYFCTILEIKEHSCWRKSKGEKSSQESSNPDTPSDLVGASNLKSTQCYAHFDEGKWTEDAVNLLIQFYKDHEGDFRKPDIRKREVWEKVALELNKEGHIFTTEQVDTKWRNLKKAYWKSKEAQCEIGLPSKFPYEERLDDVFGQYFSQKLKEKTTNPRVINSLRNSESDVSSTARGVKRLYPFNKSILKPSDTKSSGTEENIGEILKKIQTDLKNYEEEKKTHRKEKLRLSSQMHMEKMNILKELIEVIGSLSSKFHFEEH